MSLPPCPYKASEAWLCAPWIQHARRLQSAGRWYKSLRKARRGIEGSQQVDRVAVLAEIRYRKGEEDEAIANMEKEQLVAEEMKCIKEKLDGVQLEGVLVQRYANLLEHLAIANTSQRRRTGKGCGGTMKPRDMLHVKLGKLLVSGK